MPPETPCNFTTPAYKTHLQTSSHEGHNHAQLCESSGEPLLQNLLQSVETSTVTNPALLATLVCVAWYVHQAQDNSNIKEPLIDIEKLKQIATGGVVVGVGLPALYHTFGHRIGLPHFPGEAALGHTSLMLGACAGYYLRPAIDQAAKYSNIVSKLLTASG